MTTAAVAVEHILQTRGLQAPLCGPPFGTSAPSHPWRLICDRKYNFVSQHSSLPLHCKTISKQEKSLAEKRLGTTALHKDDAQWFCLLCFRYESTFSFWRMEYLKDWRNSELPNWLSHTTQPLFFPKDKQLKYMQTITWQTCLAM